jgi:Stress responsive A/B Barrel Domain
MHGRLCAVARPFGGGCYGRPMLHHVVTFDLKPDAPSDQVEQIAAALHALAATLPELRTLAVGSDLGLREGNAGFAVVATFDDVDGFRAYADHPEHLRVIKELIGPHIDGRHPVQFTA